MLGSVMPIMLTFGTPTVTTPPSISIDPAICTDCTWSCEYVSGPYQGTDLCEMTYTNPNNAIVTTTSFDSTTGVLTIDTTDEDTFTEGSYNFVITVTCGATTVSKPFSIVVGSPLCEVMNLQVVT